LKQKKRPQCEKGGNTEEKENKPNRPETRDTGFGPFYKRGGNVKVGEKKEWSRAKRPVLGHRGIIVVQGRGSVNKGSDLS